MEDIKKVKTLITRINRKCDKEGISLSNALASLGINSVNYLEIIGLNSSLINDYFKKEIDALFSLEDTRIVISPSMNSLDNDEIEIYSKKSFKVVHFLKNKITLDDYVTSSNEESTYENIFTYIRKEDEEISYKLDVTTNKDDLKTRIISEKYPLEHMYIKVDYKDKTLSKSYEFTINKDMLKSDLNFIIRVLSNFGFLDAYFILSRYPSSIKIVGESADFCIKQ